MPSYMTGNMWEMLGQVDWFCITTNAIVKNNGALVMGAGIAKQVRDYQQGIDKICGDVVRQHAVHNLYGFIEAMPGLGLFQVKQHFKDKADLGIIRHSVVKMQEHIKNHPGDLYALNFPGIGNGKLQYDEVKPIIDALPDNVTVWTFR